MFVQIIMQAVLLGSLAILPQLLQALLGYDAYKSGLSMMPRGLGALLAMVLCGTMANIIDKQRDKLFWKLIRSIIVRAVRHNGRHAIGVMICTH